MIENMLPTSPQPLREKRIYINKDQMREVQTDLITKNITFIDSVHTIYVNSLKTKYVDKDSCISWPDLLNDFILMTPGEIARTELERYCGKPNLKYRKEIIRDLLTPPPPNYFDGIKRDGNLFYVDLSGAYHQIYTHLTLDCVWPRGVGQLPLKGVAQRLAPYKLPRNAVVGITRSYQMSLVKNGRYAEMPFYNPWLSPALWRTIQSILHELANVAISRKCCYVATDGYIFTDPFNYGWFKAYLDDNGFTYKTLKGKGYIHGWADYKVGPKETKFKRESCNPLNNLMESEGTVKWFQRIRNSNPGPLTIDVL